MTRIIAGAAGGTRLSTPPGARTRPTSERVREALFSRLMHLDAIDGALVLDLYAGSGALGLEAVSRGARLAVLVESAPAVARVARRNGAAVAPGAVRVVAAGVERHLRGPAPDEPFDLVFADPPYDLSDDEVAGALQRLVADPWLADDAVVVLERSTRSPEPRWPTGLTRFGHRAYGETALWFAAPDPAA